MEETALESSIKDQAARLITAIGEKENSEIRLLEQNCMEEIESFRVQVRAEGEGRLRQELSRIENRAVLERRKRKLVGVQNFIDRMMDEVVEELRHDPQYKQFLLDAVVEAAEHIKAGFEVRLNPGDLTFEAEIRAAVATAERREDIVITEDATIQRGGCLVLDPAEGRIFNSTIERIYFRKSLLIRQEIMKILMDHSRSRMNPASPTSWS
ncbi:MAG: hypothetical protein ACP5SH_10280 [Syntrophobacteraceae bacterium]